MIRRRLAKRVPVDPEGIAVVVVLPKGAVLEFIVAVMKEEGPVVNGATVDIISTVELAVLFAGIPNVALMVEVGRDVSVKLLDRVATAVVKLAEKVGRAEAVVFPVVAGRIVVVELSDNVGSAVAVVLPMVVKLAVVAGSAVTVALPVVVALAVQAGIAVTVMLPVVVALAVEVGSAVTDELVDGVKKAETVELAVEVGSTVIVELAVELIVKVGNAVSVRFATVTVVVVVVVKPGIRLELPTVLVITRVISRGTGTMTVYGGTGDETLKERYSP